MQLGLGLYTLTDAARLVHSQPRTLKRWLCGHSYMAGKEGARQRHQVHALWQPQYDAQAMGEVVIGFQDLLELRVVREFVQHGVPLQVVRRCLATARDLFGTDHPLTRRRFVTDGATIFTESLQQVQAQASDAEHDAALLNLSSRQYAFRTIIKDSLYAGIEYSDGLARRWYPEPRSRAVVLDPARQFGHPVVDESSVPTAALYACYLSEGQSKAAVARVFEVPVKHVEAAVRFEEKLRKAA